MKGYPEHRSSGVSGEPRPRVRPRPALERWNDPVTPVGHRRLIGCTGRWRHNVAALPSCLCFIEGSIGPVEHRTGGFVGVGSGRNTGTRADRHPGVGHGERPGQPGKHPLDDGSRLTFSAQVFEQKYKFIAVEPGRGVLSAQIGRQPPGRLGQQGIASCVQEMRGRRNSNTAAAAVPAAITAQTYQRNAG